MGERIEMGELVRVFLTLVLIGDGDGALEVVLEVGIQLMGRIGYCGKKRPRKGAEAQARRSWHSSWDQMKTSWAFPVTVVRKYWGLGARERHYRLHRRCRYV